jgi:hypothetical protein
MGNSSPKSGGTQHQSLDDRFTVAEAREQQVLCKLSLGLHPSEPYPVAGYKGECDAAEQALKKALCFALDPRAARVLYDPASPRADKVEANKVRQCPQACPPPLLLPPLRLTTTSDALGSFLLTQALQPKLKRHAFVR